MMGESLMYLLASKDEQPPNRMFEKVHESQHGLVRRHFIFSYERQKGPKWSPSF